MLEYSEEYLLENERILDEMDEYMSEGAIALAKQMASADINDTNHADEE